MRIVLQDFGGPEDDVKELGIVVSSVVPRTGEEVRYKGKNYWVEGITHVYSDDDPGSVFVVCDLMPDPD